VDRAPAPSFLDAQRPLTTAGATSFPFYQQPQKPTRLPDIPPAAPIEVPRFETPPPALPATPAKKPEAPVAPVQVSTPIAGAPVQLLSGQSPLPAANPMPNLYAFPPGAQPAYPTFSAIPMQAAQPSPVAMAPMPGMTNAPVGYIVQQTPYGTGIG